MRLAAHGRSIDVPAGWEARIFRRAGAAPVLHVASFALRDQDGAFGAAATGRMRPDDMFAALVEYRSDPKLRPGEGLFACAGRPATLRAQEFRPNQLQVTRVGQLGSQRFFTEGGAPFCLYAVIQPVHFSALALVHELGRVLATLQVTTAEREAVVPGASVPGPDAPPRS